MHSTIVFKRVTQHTQISKTDSCFLPAYMQQLPAIRVARRHKTKMHDYLLAGNKLEVVNSYKYLGINMTSNLSWGNHIQQMVGKANSRLHFVQRVLRGCPLKVKSIAYFSLVRPLLEYCCTVWSPYEDGLDHAIEMVQRRAARFVSGRFLERKCVKCAVRTEMG